jgi:hypothetical protein
LWRSVATSTSAPARSAGFGQDPARRDGGVASRHRRLPLAAVAVAALIVLAGIEFVRVTHTRPSYDAFGWLTWGRQVVFHWNLNTDGAPSWKPLTFLFTLPYALFGRTQMSLWTVTASAAALASGVFAGRIAYRLTGLSGAPAPQRWPALIAGLFAGFGVLGMTGLPHQMLIATSDPMVVTLCLAAIDAHLSGWRRLAFAMVVLASLGRPEAWPFAGLYGIWCWRSVRGSRIVVVLGFLLIPGGWFVIPGLTAHTWFISGELALDFPGAIHGNKLVGVTNRFLGLYELPMQLAALGAIVLAFVRRDRVWIGLAVAAALWVAVEIAFAYHGWPASQRYLMEAAAVCVVLAGAAVGRLLDFAARGRRAGLLPAALARVRPLTLALRLAALGAVVVLGLALAPIVRHREALWRSEVHHAETVAGPIDRLQQVVKAIGGGAAVTACGKPVTFVGFQSTLAWNVGLNVGDIGYRPGRAIGSLEPIVYFRPIDGGWIVRPIHTPQIDLGACAGLYKAYDVPRTVAALAKPKVFVLRRLPPALARLRRLRSLSIAFAARRGARRPHRVPRHVHHRARLRERTRRRERLRRRGRRRDTGGPDRHTVRVRRGARAVVARTGSNRRGAHRSAPAAHRPAPAHHART